MLPNSMDVLGQLRQTALTTPTGLDDMVKRADQTYNAYLSGQELRRKLEAEQRARDIEDLKFAQDYSGRMARQNPDAAYAMYAQRARPLMEKLHGLSGPAIVGDEHGSRLNNKSIGMLEAMGDYQPKIDAINPPAGGSTYIYDQNQMGAGPLARLQGPPRYVNPGRYGTIRLQDGSTVNVPLSEDGSVVAPQQQMVAPPAPPAPRSGRSGGGGGGAVGRVGKAADWQKQVGADGKVYYINRVTNEVRAVEGVTAPTRNSGGRWEVRTDARTRREYLYNPTTGESRPKPAMGHRLDEAPPKPAPQSGKPQVSAADRAMAQNLMNLLK